MKTSCNTFVIFGAKVTSLLAAAVLFSQPAFAENPTSQPESPNYSAGITISTMGLGISAGGKTDWHLTAGDQIQWRAVVTGIDASFDGNDEIDLAGIEYNNGDFSMFATQAGVDWYPVQSGWADEVFVSTGLIYANSDFTAYADNSKTYSLGSTEVNPGDLTSLRTDIETSEILPYISLGWGNKLEKESGFDFQAEVGLALSTRDAQVKLAAIDPNNLLTAADLAEEKRQIENRIDGPMGFVSATVSYHF